MLRTIFTCAFCLLLIPGFAQDCDPYFPMDEGAMFELTSYKKKGKVTSVATHQVKEKRTMADGLEAEIETEVVDQKGKEVAKSTYTVKCEEGIFYIDMSTLMPAEQMEAYSDMEMTMEGDYLDFPPDLSVGQELADGELNIQINMGIPLKMSIIVTDRKVEAKETITTEAGTFDCYKLTYNMQMKVGMRMEFEIVEWYAKGVGMVRSESYRKGKSQGYTELTKFNP